MHAARSRTLLYVHLPVHMLVYKRDPPAHIMMCLPLSSSAVYLGKSSVSFCLRFFFKYCVYWRVLHWVVTAARGLSLAAAGGDSSRGAVRGGLAVVVSRAEHRLSGSQASVAWHMGAVVVAVGFSCSSAYGIFPDQGAKRASSLWHADS